MKNERGITMMALAITIFVILIITTTVIYSVSNRNKTTSLVNMQTDVEMLYDKILMYYNKYQTLPICEKTYSTTDGSNVVYTFNDNEIDTGFLNSKKKEDGNTYYQIDISKLKNITLNFGDIGDIFVVNEKTFNIYYINGIESNGEMVYSN